MAEEIMPPRKDAKPEAQNRVDGVVVEKTAASQLAFHGIRLRPPPGKFVVEILFELAGLVAAVAFGVYAIKSVAIANKGNGENSQAISQAETSNQLALLSICLATETLPAEMVSICAQVVAGAVSVISSAASSLFSPLPQATPVSTETFTSYITTTLPATGSQGFPDISTITSVFTMTVPLTEVSVSSTRSPNNDTAPNPSIAPGGAEGSPVSAGAIAGIVIGVVVLFMLGVGTCCLFRKRRRRPANVEHFPITGAAPPTEEAPIAHQVEAYSRSESQGLAKRLQEIFVDSTVTHVGR